jgi:hypothetical protein
MVLGLRATAMHSEPRGRRRALIAGPAFSRCDTENCVKSTSRPRSDAVPWYSKEQEYQARHELYYAKIDFQTQYNNPTLSHPPP